jgi:hypothetical protein
MTSKVATVPAIKFPGTTYTVFKVRVKNSDIQKGAGLGSKVEFASNSTSLIVYAMLWSMFYT